MIKRGVDVVPLLRGRCEQIPPGRGLSNDNFCMLFHILFNITTLFQMVLEILFCFSGFIHKETLKLKLS